MKSERLEFFKEFAYSILTQNRFPGSEGHKNTKGHIKSFLEYIKAGFREESFDVRLHIPQESYIEVDGKRIECLAYPGTPSLSTEGYVKEDFLEGDIALRKGDLSMEDVEEVKQRGGIAILTYKESLNTYHCSEMPILDLPVLSVKKGDVPEIEDYNVKLFVKSSEKIIRCSNILFEVGRGPVIYLVAHMDTSPLGYGAIDNGIGFLTLLFIYEELAKSYQRPYRLRFLITDCGSLGFTGSKFHVRNGLKHVFYCINLDGVGWRNPCVVYEDAYGYNGQRINDSFYKHVEELKVKINYVSLKKAMGDHLSFKELGVESLYLSSHPFTFKNTLYDNYDAIDWDTFNMWYEVILSFLRRFHKI
ncbi:MAG: Zn-dependent exopeptidase M28 [Acidobacteria bacterium]|jgi:Iap family predicted aminopeptidase|nr:MAG: Zn-dependent exopeptidase M28 [Acidobacteriota bacterium]